MDFPCYHQEELYTCGAAVTRMILESNGIKKSEEELVNDLGVTIKEGVTLERIKILFNELNFETKYHDDLKLNLRIQKINEYSKNGYAIIILVNRFVYDSVTPRIGSNVDWEDENKSYHFIIIKEIKDDKVYFIDPHVEVGKSILDKSKFLDASTEYLLAIKPTRQI